MKIYREQNGCHNCVHLFRWYEYDSESEYFCLLDAPERPLSGSVAMGECSERIHPSPNINWLDLKNEEEERLAEEYERKSIEFHEIWQKWREARHVELYGICDAWELAEEEEIEAE